MGNQTPDRNQADNEESLRYASTIKPKPNIVPPPEPKQIPVTKPVPDEEPPENPIEAPPPEA